MHYGFLTMLEHQYYGMEMDECGLGSMEMEWQRPTCALSLFGGSLVKREAIGDPPWHVMSGYGDPLDSKFQITPYFKFKDLNDV
jgi:hypothetical protein